MCYLHKMVVENGPFVPLTELAEQSFEKLQYDPTCPAKIKLIFNSINISIFGQFLKF